MNLLQRILYFPSQNFVHAEKRVNFVEKFSISTNNIITVESCQGKYGGTLDFIYEFSYVQAIQGILVYRKKVYFKLPSSPVQC